MAAEGATIRAIFKAAEIGGKLMVGTGSQIYNLEENIRWTERKMRSLHSYLKDADSKRSTSHEVANLIIDIRDLAEDVVDILHKYFPDTESHSSKGASSFLSFGAKAISFGLEIKKIKKRVDDIEISTVRCGVTAVANAGAVIDAKLQDSRKSFLHAPGESKIVGREGILRNLEEEIISEDSRLIIKSIVGPAGVGKTTVGKRVYGRTENRFDVSARVYVSQVPNLAELLLDIADQVGLSKEKVEKDLERNLYSLLQEKRFLIFLDDIWYTQTWDSLLISFLPTNSENGSRIMVTCRYDDVGRYIGGERSLVPLDILGEKEGMELFFDSILQPYEEPLPPVLREIGEWISERCGGLPLAIVVMAGLLKRKERSTHAWKEVQTSMSQGVEKTCLEILALSYQDLPTELKPLFLYFGMFPEDSEIFVNGLIDAWVAEKLIKPDGSRKPESIAEASIDEFISRNLIQVSRRRSDGRARSLRIHDVLHTLCINLAEENNFFCILHKLKTIDTAPIVRRITCTSSEPVGHRVPEKVRSSLCFGGGHHELLKFLKRNALDLSFLQILIIEMGRGQENNLPDEIANLSGLIYLKLKGRFTSGIPSGLSNLKNLLTLMVRSLSSRVHITGRILQMKQLKHLTLQNVSFDIDSLSAKPQYPKGVEVVLPNLETLDFDDVEGYYFTPYSFNESKLRKLRTRQVPRQPLSFLSDAKPSLQNLEDLKLGHCFEDEMGVSVPRLDLSSYQYLVRLHLERFPSRCQINFPPNLVQVVLERANDKISDLVESLKTLSKLEIIKIKDCYGFNNLDFSGEHSFPQLQVLVLRDVHFHELIVDEEGMPKLYKMIYRPPDHRICSQIIPERLKKIMVEHGR
ncbi:UNVERIFIED_CONTAM: ToMV resistance protein Tm-2 [Sesamum calycinum]|uniref:ToMV resistance protein Tm-2 n=1 Tax=Sesamum calycinum TaxID=2727403 RepID=A0AAW2RPU1_9LAMI